MRSKLRRNAVITGGYDPEYTRELKPHNRFERALEVPPQPAAAAEGNAQEAVSATPRTEARPPIAASNVTSTPLSAEVPVTKPKRRHTGGFAAEATTPATNEPIAPSKRKRTVGVPKARTEVLVCPTDEQTVRVGQGDLPADMAVIAALALKRLRSTFAVDLARPPEAASSNGDQDRQRFPASVRIPEVDMEAYRAAYDPFSIETTARLVGGQIRTAFQAEVDAVISILAARRS